MQLLPRSCIDSVSIQSEKLHGETQLFLLFAGSLRSVKADLLDCPSLPCTEYYKISQYYGVFVGRSHKLLVKRVLGLRLEHPHQRNSLFVLLGCVTLSPRWRLYRRE